MGLIEEYKKVAVEGNELFSGNASRTVQFLPPSLQPLAAELVKTAAATPTKLPKSLVYIPITHSGLWEPELDEKLSDDVFNLLTSLVKKGDQIVVGDIVEGDLKKASVYQRSGDMFKYAASLGVGNQEGVVSFQKFASQAEPGFQRALFRYLTAKPFMKAIATDSKLRIIIAMYLEKERMAQSTPYTYLAVEAATRYALVRGCNKLGPASRMIFIQGTAHEFGVENWCKRYSIPYSMRVPKILRETIGAYRDIS